MTAGRVRVTDLRLQPITWNPRFVFPSTIFSVKVGKFFKKLAATMSGHGDGLASAIDIEKKGDYADTQVQPVLEEGETIHSGWWDKIKRYGVETRGIQPVPVELRTDPRAVNIFSFWWTLSLNLLP